MEAMLIILAFGYTAMIAFLTLGRGKKFKGDEGIIPMPNNKHELAEKEKGFLYLSIELWNAYLNSPLYDKNDVDKIYFHIHAIQDIVIRRQMSEDDKDVRPIMPPDKDVKVKGI